MPIENGNLVIYTNFVLELPINTYTNSPVMNEKYALYDKAGNILGYKTYAQVHPNLKTYPASGKVLVPEYFYPEEIDQFEALATHYNLSFARGLSGDETIQARLLSGDQALIRKSQLEALENQE